jgi:hypothetical protein
MAILNAAFAGLVAGLAGCGTGETAAPVIDPWKALSRLTLNYRAANLSTAAPYDTVRLVATPRDSLGNPIAGLPTPTFRLRAESDSITVWVTADGLVTARAEGAFVGVIAQLTNGSKGWTDTLMVNVKAVPTPPELDTFSIHPLLPADTLLPMPPSPLIRFVLDAAGLVIPTRLQVRALDVHGATISGLQIAFASLDTAVATIDRGSGEVTLVHPGQVRLVAQTYAYGIAKVDTVRMTVTWPTGMDVEIHPGTGGVPAFQTLAQAGVSEMHIAPGGIVMWSNYSGDAVDLTFDDPANVAAPTTALCMFLVDNIGPGAYCGSGNVAVPANANPADDSSVLFTLRLRQFSVPGVYSYHTVNGASSRIVVTTGVP